MAKTKVFRKKTLKKSTKKHKMSINSKYGKKKNKTIKNKGGGDGRNVTIESITDRFSRLKKYVKDGFFAGLSRDPSKATISTAHLGRKK